MPILQTPTVIGFCKFTNAKIKGNLHIWYEKTQKMHLQHIIRVIHNSDKYLLSCKSWFRHFYNQWKSEIL